MGYLKRIRQGESHGTISKYNNNNINNNPKLVAVELTLGLKGQGERTLLEFRRK